MVVELSACDEKFELLVNLRIRFVFLLLLRYSIFNYVLGLHNHSSTTEKTYIGLH